MRSEVDELLPGVRGELAVWQRCDEGMDGAFKFWQVVVDRGLKDGVSGATGR